MRINWPLGLLPRNLALIMPILLMASAARAADVSFYALYPSEKFDQPGADAATLAGNTPFRLGASVGSAAAGSVISATVMGGNLGTVSLPSNPDNTFGGDLKFPSLAALEAAAPAGNYVLTANTLHDGQRKLTLTLPAETVASFPQAPHLSNWPAAQSIKPGADFTLTWDPFVGGTTNDFILVQVADQNTGNILLETGLPNEPGALNGKAASVVIPAALLAPSTNYLVEIGFYKVVTGNTASYPGALGIVAFSSQTDLGITTLAPPAQGADVGFYAIFKSAKFNQVGSGPPTLGGNTPYRFGSSLGATAAGSVTSATVSGGNIGTQTLTFNPGDNTFSSNLKYSSLAAMDAAAPAGTYFLTINTLHDGQRKPSLTMPAETLASFPQPPHISNFTAAQAIPSGANFTLTWDPWMGGTTSDFILLQMGDPNTGNTSFQTGDPFQPGALNGTATSVVIPAAMLASSTTYTVEIGFYKFASSNTTSYPGAVGIVAFSSLTDLNISTSASAIPIEFGFLFRHFAEGGEFLDSTNATPQFPAAISGYRAELTVNDSATFASPSQVFFSGPAGSGIDAAPSDPAIFSSTTTNAFYFSPFINQPPNAPGGVWSVSYANSLQQFSMPDPQASSRLVVPVPKLGVANDIVKQAEWSFFDANGNALSGTPPVVVGIRMQALDASDSILYDSGPLSLTELSHTLASSLNWLNVNTIRFLYKDNLTNVYIVSFPKVTAATPIQLEPVNFSPAIGFVFALSGQAGRGYRIQFSADLVNWTDLVTTNLPSPRVQLLDSQAKTSTARFYRATLAN
jgi:hypothetical protein